MFYELTIQTENKLDDLKKETYKNYLLLSTLVNGSKYQVSFVVIGRERLQKLTQF